MAHGLVSVLQRAGRDRFVLATSAGVVAACVIAGTQFPAAGNDDSHITFWAARSLSEHGTILNYNGQHVEQSSSLTLVVLLGLLHFLLHAPIPAIAWWVSVVAGAGAIVVTALLARELGLASAPWVPLLLGTSLPFVYWTTSGMESSLMALLSCAVVLVVGRSLKAGRLPRAARAGAALFLMLAFAGVRPEATVALLTSLAGVALVALVVARAKRTAVWLALRWLAAGAVAVAVLLAIRWLCFRALLPHSATAKLGGFSVAGGARYFWSTLKLTNFLFLPVASIGAFQLGRDALAGRANGVAAPLLAMTLSLVGFVLMSGGDWMPAGRFVAPALPGLCLLAGVFLEHARKESAVAAPLIALSMLGLDVRSALEFGGSRANGSYSGDAAWQGEDALVGPARPAFTFAELGNKAHRRDARLLGALLDIIARLHPTTTRPLYVMSGQAGMVPYYAFGEHEGALRFIDLWAITSDSILPCVPANERRVGIHGVQLDPVFVIEEADHMPARCGARRPGIVFSTGRFPHYLAAHGYEKLYQGPRGLEAYVAVDEQLWHQAAASAEPSSVPPG